MEFLPVANSETFDQPATGTDDGLGRPKAVTHRENDIGLSKDTSPR
jgi:hypothetical protein